MRQRAVMKYRIVLANFTVSVDEDSFILLRDALGDPESRWFPLEVSAGKWIVPAQVVAVEAVIIEDGPPDILSFPAET